MDTIETKPELKYMDLMYFGYEWDKESREFQEEYINQIKEQFPKVELHNVFDEIKGYRQEVFLEEKDHDNYYSWLIGKAWYEMSMTMQLIMMSGNREPEQTEKFDKYIALAKQQYPEAFKSED